MIMKYVKCESNDFFKFGIMDVKMHVDIVQSLLR